MSESDVYRRQILTSTVDPRVVRIRLNRYYVWVKPKHIEFAQVLATFFSSDSNFIVLFLPQFSSHRLQTLAQCSLCIDVSCNAIFKRE